MWRIHRPQDGAEMRAHPTRKFAVLHTMMRLPCSYRRHEDADGKQAGDAWWREPVRVDRVLPLSLSFAMMQIGVEQ